MVLYQWTQAAVSRSSSARPVKVGCSVDQLRFIQSHGRFHQRVVQRVPDAADRAGDARLVQGLGERDRRVLTASVRVMHQTRCGETELGRTAGEQRLLQDRRHQRRRLAASSPASPRMRRENTSMQNAV